MGCVDVTCSSGIGHLSTENLPYAGNAQVNLGRTILNDAASEDETTTEGKDETARRPNGPCESV